MAHGGGMPSGGLGRGMRAPAHGGRCRRWWPDGDGKPHPVLPTRRRSDYVSRRSGWGSAEGEAGLNPGIFKQMLTQGKLLALE